MNTPSHLSPDVPAADESSLDLEQAAVEAGVPLELLRGLIELRQRDFSSLDRWGAKKEFENAIGRYVTKAAMQDEKVFHP